MNNQTGVTILFLVVIVTALIGMVGLVIDSARLTLVAKQLQNAADSAALAAANRLDKSVTGFRASKQVCKAALSQANIINVTNPVDTNFAFDDGVHTPLDLPPDQCQEGTTGNLKIRIVRGIYCYQLDASGTLQPFYQEADTSGANDLDYCKVNHVRVIAEITDFPTSFARIFGIERISKVVRTADATVRDIPETCGKPLCSDLPLTCPSP